MVFKSILVSRWVGKTEADLDVDALEIATDIHKRAVILAPKDTRALANDGRIERVRSGFYKIIFGSSRVPYARKRHFENKKNPQSLGYLAKAGDGVARGNVKKYLRQR